jgi:hypothetical protein
MHSVLAALDGRRDAPEADPVIARLLGWPGILLVAGCATSGSGDRPPAAAPAPSPAAISNVGFDRALKAGSDYVVASTGVDHPTLQQSQTLPSGLLQLTFDLGPGVPEPVRVTVDPERGKVQSLEPVVQVPGLLVPAKTR